MVLAVTRHTFLFSPGQGESGFPKLLNRIPPLHWAWVSPTQSQWPLTCGLCSEVLPLIGIPPPRSWGWGQPQIAQLLLSEGEVTPTPK